MSVHVHRPPLDYLNQKGGLVSVTFRGRRFYNAPEVDKLLIHKDELIVGLENDFAELMENLWK